MASYTLAESYSLSSKVRSKLTREASDPRATLRSLVTQANMLDRILEHIENESEKRRTRMMDNHHRSTVTFDVHHHKRSYSQDLDIEGASVSAYEVEPDSDDDYAVYSSDSDSSEDDLEFDSEEEEDYQYGSLVSMGSGVSQPPIYRELPTITLSEDKSLSILAEQEEDDEEEGVKTSTELPELSGSLSSTDEEDFEEEPELEHVWDQKVDRPKMKRKPSLDSYYNRLLTKPVSSRSNRSSNLSLEELF